MGIDEAGGSRRLRRHSHVRFPPVEVGGAWQGGGMSFPVTDFDERYRAISARDTRFDGQFVTAVSSTGIYCRPSCPARTPKPQNVTFYPTSAAAHEAGYRACKRCLPEAAPGSPAWDIRGDVAARAMRLISDGVVEREGVPGLAARLGYSSRHLTRLLATELGAGPLALARAHRAHTARMLLVGTDMPISDVAFSAGFASIRQCNDTIREVFGLTPGELRARRRLPASAVPGAIDLVLPYRGPLDASGIFAWMAARAVPGVEETTATSFSRHLRMAGGPAWFEVSQDATERLHLRARVARLGDLAPLVVDRATHLRPRRRPARDRRGALRTPGARAARRPHTRHPGSRFRRSARDAHPRHGRPADHGGRRPHGAHRAHRGAGGAHRARAALPHDDGDRRARRRGAPRPRRPHPRDHGCRRGPRRRLPDAHGR
jgi:AraC family transcriptional regulator of adaptative response / DNA-3-methyladenine glycosylase II